MSEADKLAKKVVSKLQEMSSDARMNFIERLREHFCIHCGSSNPDCWCQYDSRLDGDE